MFKFLKRARNTPDFLCIGAQKAGTTWLHAMLVQHPDIWDGPFKEHQFFNSLYCPQQTKQARNQMTGAITRRIRKAKDPEHRKWLKKLAEPEFLHTEAWYREVFSHPDGRDKIKMDITPSYSTLPDEGVEYACRLLGRVPIIFMVRDPLSREISQIRMDATRKMKRQGLTSLSVKQWRSIAANMSERGDYKSAVDRWERVFGNRVHYVAFRRIATEPLEVLREIEKHIGVKGHHYAEPEKPRWQGSKMDVPNEIIEGLSEKVAPQYEFLKNRFGSDFLAATK